MRRRDSVTSRFHSGQAARRRHCWYDTTGMCDVLHILVSNYNKTKARQVWSALPAGNIQTLSLSVCLLSLWLWTQSPRSTAALPWAPPESSPQLILSAKKTQTFHHKPSLSMRCMQDSRARRTAQEAVHTWSLRRLRLQLPACLATRSISILHELQQSSECWTHFRGGCLYKVKLHSAFCDCFTSRGLVRSHVYSPDGFICQKLSTKLCSTLCR